MAKLNEGAEIKALYQRTSVDLAAVIKLLSDSIIDARINPSPNINIPPQQRPLFLYESEKKRLRICTSGVLRRLFWHPDYVNTFNPEKGGGFLIDFEAPNYGSRTRVGGQLREGNIEKLPHNLDNLIEKIDQALDSALPKNFDFSSFLLDDTASQLRALAKRINTKFSSSVSKAQLVPLTFSDNSDDSVAKVITAVEKIEARDYFNKLGNAIGQYLQKEYSLEPDEVDLAIECLRVENEKNDSQIKRFLNFLDNEALAKLRLQITFQIMEAIADKSLASDDNSNFLREYVNRIKCFIELLKTEGLTLNFTAIFGLQNEFELADYIENNNFFNCLSVFPEYKTQIFEEKSDNPEEGYSVLREVSYRFRVNGKNPEYQTSAFEARLEKIEQTLFPQEKIEVSPNLINWHLAELFFLAVVIPKSNQEGNFIHLDKQQLCTNVQKLIKTIKTKESIQGIIKSLKNRKNSVQNIADCLVATLKKKGDKIIEQVQKNASQQFICVKEDIVDWERLKGAEPGTKDLLKGDISKGIDKIEWLKHIEISTEPNVSNLLFTVKVNTELSEHNLCKKESEINSIQVQRNFDSQLLQIHWVPYNFEKTTKEYNACQLAFSAKNWILPTMIQVEYETDILQTNPQKREKYTKHLHAAAVTAFTVLVYSCLWRIVEKIKTSNPQNIKKPENSGFTTLILRLQEKRNDAAKNKSPGEDYVYAASQAIEAMLAQDNPTQMQGVVLPNLSNDWAKKGTFDALQAAFPIRISTKTAPKVNKVGLISYISRPCDESSQTELKNHLFLSQSYLATAQETPFPGYELESVRMQSDIIYFSEELREQRLIREEISYLEKQGCNHIILLSHAYKTRRFHKAFDYNTPLITKQFLDVLSESFPSLTIYTMMRDVFPATRLYKRGSNEAAFEILRANDHLNFPKFRGTNWSRGILPIYTFATLSAVEENKRPQSGFCCYFLVSDKDTINIDWIERARQHLIDPEENSSVNPCLLTILRGLHFIESEKGVSKNGFLPVLDPFGWISPTTVEGAGEVEIMPSRRKGKVLLSYPAILTHVAKVLHRKKHP